MGKSERAEEGKVTIGSTPGRPGQIRAGSMLAIGLTLGPD